MSVINLLQLKTTRNTPGWVQCSLQGWREHAGAGDHDHSVSARGCQKGVTGLGLGLIDLGEGLRKWGFTLDWVLSGKQG